MNLSDIQPPRLNLHPSPPKILFFLKLLFPFFGVILLLIAGYLSYQRIVFLQEGIVDQGVVIDFEEQSDEDGITYAPVIEFTYKDDIFRFVSGVRSSSPPVNLNDRVNIVFNPQNPSYAEINTFLTLWFPQLLLGFLGIAFSSVGIFFMVYFLRTKRQREYLDRFGLVLPAQVRSIQQNTLYHINNKHPWVIGCEAEYMGQVRTFKSENLWQDPHDSVQVGDRISVRIDPQNPLLYRLEFPHSF